MRWPCVLLFVAACYSPSVSTGAHCDKDSPCPRPLVCSEATATCEHAQIDAAVDPVDADETPDAFVPPIDAPPVQGCVPSGFDICNDGIDQDCSGADAVCAANDLAADAIDVTAGGMQSGDLNLSRDNAPQKACGDKGGRDLFYKVTLTDPQVYYFDTFGSNFDTVLRVFPGKACTAVTAADLPSCSNDDCGGVQTQLALELPAGTSCIVVDQKAGEAQGALALKVTPGGHDGMHLAAGPQTLSGDNCNSKDTWKGLCSDVGGKEQAYFFTVCPNTTAHLSASTCADPTLTHFDTVLYVRKGGSSGPGTTLKCSDDEDACAPRPERPDHADGSILDNVAASGPGLFFMLIEGYDGGACGGWSMSADLE